MLLFVLVLFLALLLDSQELLVVNAASNGFVLDAVAPMFEDIARKLGISIVAVQTAPRRAAAEAA